MTKVDRYLDEVERTLRLDRKQRSIVVAELRSHILERASDLLRQDPTLRTPAAEDLVLADLGDPRTLAISYGDTETVIRTRRGDVALRVARAVGRGTRAFLKWTAISLAFLLVLGAIVAYAAYQESKPYLESEHRTNVYDHTESCSRPCTTLTIQETFGPTAGARQLQATMDGAMMPAGGSVHITVKDPDGKIVVDKTYTGTTSAQSMDSQAAWSPIEGSWTVTLQMTGFQGSFTFRVVSVGLPPGSL